MQLLLIRDPPGKEWTLGTLSINGIWQCMTREPAVRADRLYVPGESALPTGFYNLSITYCRRFKRELPLLASTMTTERRRASDRIGMRIHPGHSVQAFESWAEILLGQERDGKTIVRSRPAFDAFMERIQTASGEAIDMEIR